MRLLLDTHAFVWFVSGDSRLPTSARELIARTERIALSVASVWEGELKRAAGRLDAPNFTEAAGAAGLTLLPIIAAHAEVAANLPPYHRDPFDRMLVAQTLTEGCVLVSKDEVIRRYGVPVSW